MTKALVTTGAIIITIIAETDPAHTSKCAKKKHQKSTATMAEKVEKAALDNQTRCRYHLHVKGSFYTQEVQKASSAKTNR